MTPLAGFEGQVVADNLLKGNHRKSDAGVVPTVAFTIPPIASAGMREEDARSQGLHFRTNFQETSGWYESRRVAERHSGFKVLVEEGSDRILGAHLLGHNAEELVNIFTMAIRTGIRAADVKAMIFAYPASTSNTRYML
jgi:glutathione reductase (NADPH)